MENIFNNFACDFTQINLAKSPEELDRFVELAMDNYPLNNEDNACIIALCLNPALSPEQMLRLGYRYGKYIKENSAYQLSIIEASDDSESLKKIGSSSGLPKYDSIIEFSGLNKPYIKFSEGNSYSYSLVDSCEDLHLLKCIFFINEILNENLNHINKYIAGKNLQKLDIGYFNKVAIDWASSFINIHLFGHEFVYLNNCPKSLKDYDYIFPEIVIEHFENEFNKLEKTHSNGFGKFMVCNCLKLIHDCYQHNNNYNWSRIARRVLMIGYLQFSYFNSKEIENFFDGKIKEFYETIKWIS